MAAEQVKGELWLNLGYRYLGRRRGDLAGNLEKAIGASEAAITVFTREAATTDTSPYGIAGLVEAVLKNAGHLYFRQLG